MHASVTVHLCQHWLLDPLFGEFGPNPAEFALRFQDHPEYLDNLHFVYGMVLRAVVKAVPLWRTYLAASAEGEHPLIDKSVQQKFLQMLEQVRSQQPFFEEGLLFADADDGLRAQFRDNMRAVTRAINCVGCERCRLWGKLQVCSPSYFFYVESIS